MALGLLLIFFVSLFVMVFLCLTLLWIIKSERVNKVIVWICFLLSLFITYISVTSFPTNYIISKSIAWIIGGIGVIGLISFLTHRVLLAKVLLTISVCLGMLQLFFF